MSAGHDHHPAAGGDQRLLGGALALILAFMAGEVVVGLAAGSLALLSDAAHMLTDAASLILALIAMRLAVRPPRGGYTYGLRRAEILSAQANGMALLVLAVALAVEAIRHLVSPPPVAGTPVLVTALVGIVVNLAATLLISRANRDNLNIRGAFAHILTDLYAFVATAAAGLVIILAGYRRADGVATLVVAALMVRAGVGLLRASGRILLEAAPAGIDPAQVGTRLARVPGVAEVHDLHVWQIGSDSPALSAHVLVAPGGDCHDTRRALERLLHDAYGIEHTTLQVDHKGDGLLQIGQDRPPH
ncbi:cation diffusion facilitator family transporter [Rugosimonospora africana]|uniref:Putative cation transporter n=1 Tax=Rugosimonospora africana TaxID=556532 RepID=A0A8J3R1V4_9ACTN|nr:cation diffusion facilitator family transporter [Rugosimonospora africana]GIH20093.1 putative cation transporter [Rugosimonospora africana]